MCTDHNIYYLLFKELTSYKTIVQQMVHSCTNNPNLLLAIAGRDRDLTNRLIFKRLTYPILMSMSVCSSLSRNLVTLVMRPRFPDGPWFPWPNFPFSFAPHV